MALYAFDGTSKEDETENEKDTNVVRFARAYRGRRFYRPGVGTRFGGIGRLFGRWVGAGLHQRVDEAVDALERNFERGDREIDVVGFSRGAAGALHFVNQIWDTIGNPAPGCARGPVHRALRHGGVDGHPAETNRHQPRSRAAAERPQVLSCDGPRRGSRFVSRAPHEAAQAGAPRAGRHRGAVVPRQPFGCRRR
jgi:hypothetical protein